MRPSLLLAALALPAAACNMARMGVNMTAPALKLAGTAIDVEPDVRFARDGAPGAIKTVEGFLVTSPDNPDLLETAAQGNAEYAFGFLEDDVESLGDAATDEQKADAIERATIHYDRAFAYAIRLAALRDKAILTAVKGDTDGLVKLLAERFTKKEHAPAIFWMGMSMGSGINLHRDDVDRIADLPKATALLTRAWELDPTYRNYQPALTLAVLYSAAGPAMGGNPAKSRQLFDQVIAGTGGKFLLAKVMLARAYAAVTQDRDLYEKTLREVLAAPRDIWPEQRLANEIAKRRAARYLKQADDIF